MEGLALRVVLLLILCACGAGWWVGSRTPVALVTTSQSRLKLLRGKTGLFMTSKISDPLVAHPSLVKGDLPNGLTYFILPNGQPSGRFEAHLEIMSGSAMELEDQQGMAHLLEHIAYMGSTKRQLISGTGSKTNAYTDFHHTVFFASCPVAAPGQFWRKPMLPMALDALLDVMTTTVSSDRLEKERAAVLSEASMVNKMDYRVECQIIQALHKDNIISRRFPIGRIEQIERWTEKEVQQYHDMHYRPDNAVLYVVGNVDAKEARTLITSKFGGLSAKVDTHAILRESGQFPQSSVREKNRHYPMVSHEFVPAEAPAVVGLHHSGQDLANLLKPVTRVFRHDLLQASSFHLFAKRPVVPCTSEEDYKYLMIQRIILSTLQVRLNVMQRDKPLFTFADFNQMPWTREGCQVCSLDLSSDPDQWKEAVAVATQEIRRLGLFGLTAGEIERFKLSLLADSHQRSSQDLGNEELLQNLMDMEAHGHVFMHPDEQHRLLQRLLATVTAEEVAKVAGDMCSHLSHLSDGCKPNAMVLCSPSEVSEDEVVEAVVRGLQAEVGPLGDIEVPPTLLPDAVMQQKAVQHPPRFVPLAGQAVKEFDERNDYGLVAHRLSNGVKVNLMLNEKEANKVSIRLYLPGGRMAERWPGSIFLGSKVVQEGGAFGNFTREQVEMFCVDHQVLVEVKAKDDAVVVDLDTVTSRGPGGLSGFEAAMQVVHMLLTDVLYEQNAYLRAQQVCEEAFSAATRALESACQQRLLHTLTDGDSRVLQPSPEALHSISCLQVEDEMRTLLCPDNLEVSIVGNVALVEQEELVLRYLGTVPPRGAPAAQALPTMVVRSLGGGAQLGVFLPDSDRRALGWLAGAAPSRLGVFANGLTVVDRLAARAGKELTHWRHPLFPQVLLDIVQEVANRRLFSVVREERQLTYDAAMQLHGSEGVRGSFYTVCVTSNPDSVQAALTACVEALQSLGGMFGVTGDSVLSAKHALLQRKQHEQNNNKYLLDQLSGCQLDLLRGKTFRNIPDYDGVVNSVTLQDVQSLIEIMQFQPENMAMCVGVAAPEPPPGMVL